jgi:excinuclease ABC subunit A
MNDKIIIRGAREHNLKSISLELPRNKLIVFTGLSGSGKSSLAFDTIFAEGQRRYVESLSAYARQFLGQMDKPDVDEIEGLSPAISIDQKAHSSNPRSTVATLTEIYDYLRVLFARIGKPHCPKCGKEIRKMTVEEMVNKIIERLADGTDKTNRSKGSDSVIVLAPAVRGRKGEYYQLFYDFYNQGFSEVRVDGKFRSLADKISLSRYKEHTIEVVVDRVTIGWPIEGNKIFRQRMAEAIELAIKYGNDLAGIILSNGEEMLLSSRFSCPDDDFSFPEIEPRLFSFNSPHGACPACHGLGKQFFFSEELCPRCLGKRLRDEAFYVLIGRKNIDEVVKMPIDAAYEFFQSLDKKLSKEDLEIAKTPMLEIKNRLKFLLDVGLNYLTLNREAGTLSGGEAQRIRLASQLGSRLTGTLYVLDEPTVGLHPKDTERLLGTLLELRDLGNTLIVVEHDPMTIAASDYLVDLGPAAGKNGGFVVASGETAKLLNDKIKKSKSLTLQYLSGEKKIEIPRQRRGDGKEAIKIIGAKCNNLKNINVQIPLKRFVCVTGVSGSGKSTLIYDILHKAAANQLDKTTHKVGEHKEIKGLDLVKRVIEIDQSPIGRSPRSNPATYVGVFTPIRELFALLPEAKSRGFTASRFSFNVHSGERGGGRCENCEGSGFLAIEMHFMPAVYITCGVCRGKRFDRETLEVKYKGKNIYDVLKMTIDDADEFFKDIPSVHSKLKVLREIGLGYLELGQPATTLSGGEAERVKLGAELSRPLSNRTLYLLDEPTIGLHYDDVKKLIEVLERLVSQGNSVVVIEHNLDVIKCADWVIDLGPGGGNRGGEIMASGTPEEVARKAGSATGECLRKVLGYKL